MILSSQTGAAETIIHHWHFRFSMLKQTFKRVASFRPSHPRTIRMLFQILLSLVLRMARIVFLSLPLFTPVLEQTFIRAASFLRLSEIGMLFLSPMCLPLKMSRMVFLALSRELETNFLSQMSW